MLFYRRSEGTDCLYTTYLAIFQKYYVVHVYYTQQVLAVFMLSITQMAWLYKSVNINIGKEGVRGYLFQEPQYYSRVVFCVRTC